ncbi:MAG: amino acid ABC transporter substrate-binding protein [Alphaproteobacteria bacterium]|nr:amino acid ABC transporter substrate-binding protein [Alphaproteobacteria bacterium]
MTDRTRAALSAASLAAALSLLFARGLPAQPTTSPVTLEIGYVTFEGDRRYEPVRGSERMVLATRDRPFPAAELALAEAAPIARVIHRDFALQQITAGSEDALAPAMESARQRGIALFVLDLPAVAIERLVPAFHGKSVLMFNTTAEEDGLRRGLCMPELVHTMPSQAMLSDALAQYLVSRKWPAVLLLQGPQEPDRVWADAFAHSAAKFGARLVDRRLFKLGNDPRQRDANNVALLTATDRDYDSVVVADSDGEFARMLPYRTARPRPVLGATGLVPEAWDRAWDRYGAPQLTNRFLAQAHRPMTGRDWSVWIATKMIVQAALRSKSADFAQLRDELLSDAGYDGVKGLAVGVRPWDHQLRQAVLLATPDAVIAQAPLPGFLHATNELDTLGDDRPETPCHLDGG